MIKFESFISNGASNYPPAPYKLRYITKGTDKKVKKEYEQLKEMIEEAEIVVFFGGAGVSTESGLKDFRGKGGFYTEESTGINPAEILSHNYFIRNPDEFYNYYKKNMLFTGVQPNPAHYALARLEQTGKLSAVVTQNVDGLHQLAGSETVYELHGTVHGNHCMNCGKFFPISVVEEADGAPYCDSCGGLIRPDIVLYGEGLDAYTWYASQEAIINADLLIVAGTSLVVEPAASLVSSFRGNNLVIINKTPTPQDGRAALVIRDPVGEVLGAILDEYPKN